MSILGDIERLLANLYPYRLPLTILGGLAVIGVLILVRRRGWHLVARRHPRATVAILAVVIAVGAPVTWVLGSPLFIRTVLVEAPSVTSGATALMGEFHGADEFHTGSGIAEVVETPKVGSCFDSNRSRSGTVRIYSRAPAIGSSLAPRAPIALIPGR